MRGVCACKKVQRMVAAGQKTTAAAVAAVVVVLQVVLLLGVVVERVDAVLDPLNPCLLNATVGLNKYDKNVTACLFINGTHRVYFGLQVDDFSLIESDDTFQRYVKDLAIPYLPFDYNVSNCTNATVFTNDTVCANGTLQVNSTDNSTYCEEQVTVCHNDTFTNTSAPYHTVTLQLQIGLALSPVKEWNFFGGDRVAYVVPFLTAVTRIKDGNVTGIYWDDGCDACFGASCSNSSCGVPIDECNIPFNASLTVTNITSGVDSNPDCNRYPLTACTTETDCDAKVYVSWIGTDSNGDFMTSAGLRISQFRSFSIKTAYETASRTTNARRPNIYVP